MPSDAVDQRIERSDEPHTRRVDLKQYRELLVSRRKLERVFNRPGWLHDRESNELFVLLEFSDASVTQRV